MKAVIMAGGEGTRLRPLTSLLPKPMVPIVNQPVMEHILGLVKHHGIDEVVATLAFMPQVIQDYFGAGDEWSMSIDYVIEETPLGTAGSVLNARSLLPDDEPFLVISGDALTDIDLSEAISFHKERGAAVTIVLKAVDDPLEFGVVITDSEGRVERFVEKPSWGQVFSDRINTGIYVIEPWVLDEIPEGPYDFSGDLFPRLLEAGHPIFGVVSDRYWCDVGSLDSYRSVHQDVLDEKAMLFIPGIHAREGLWVSETATVEEGAVLGEKVVLGPNVVVRAGAHIGDYTVLGPNVVVGADANVSHTVAWEDAFIGKQASVEGAVLCRSVDVRARSVIDVGAVIGSESVIGKGAHVGANVQVFPYKRIAAAATVMRSIIWESTGARTLFGDAGVTGIVGIDITAELALKLGEAFGSLLPKGAHIAISRDMSKSSRMVKRAMIAGVNSTGAIVRDLRVAAPAVSRFTTQKTRCLGGIHISMSENDPQMLEIRFFDKQGLDISSAQQKKIERLYFRGEFRRAFLADVGEIIYPPRPLEYYTAALDNAIESAELGDEWMTVVADYGCGAASIALPLVATGWGLKLIALNPVVDTETDAGCGEPSSESIETLRRAVDLFGANVGASFDRGAERVRLMTPSGRLLDGDTQLHVVLELLCRTRPELVGDVAVPLTASHVTEQVCERYGRRVIRPGRSRRAVARAVVEGQAVVAGTPHGGYIFGDFFPAFDGVLTVGMVSRMLASLGESLDEVADRLPACHKVCRLLACPSDRKGALMRVMTEYASGKDADLTEGVRVRYPDGWVLVLPDAVEPVVEFWAEGPDDETAEKYAAEWMEVASDVLGAG